MVWLYNDASTFGKGAVYNATSIQGFFPEPLQSAHIGIKELYTTHSGLAFASMVCYYAFASMVWNF